MKKHLTLKFLALSALLMLGNVAANAAARDAAGPADGTAVGATIKIGDQIGLVTYRVTGWNTSKNFYTVKITGFDRDGLDALAVARSGGAKVTLRVPVTFEEKFGEKKYKYAVTQIDDGLVGTTKQSFYGIVEVDTLIFVNDKSKYNGVNLSDFSYTVGTKAFYGCTNMKKLEFTENCASIGTYAFQNCAIKDFEIPKMCATIGSYAFYNCKRLQTVTVASGNAAMHSLGDFVFGNSSLKTLDLRNASQLWEITGTPFMYDLSVINDVLTTVYLPVEVKRIDAAFKNCTALTNVYGFEKTSIGVASANKVLNANGAEISRPSAPVGLDIQPDAFNGCRSLTRLDIPSCNVNGSPFIGCESLDTLTFNGSYKSKTIANGLTAGYNLFGDYTPANVVAADQAALKVIAFNNDFRGTIQNDAFVGVTALDSVGFKKLTNGATIGGAFKDVTSLNKLTFTGINTYVDATDKDGLVVIAPNAFKNTGITALDFKAINLEGANDAFFIIANDAFSGCAALTDIKFGNITVKNGATFSISYDAFNHNPVLAKVTFGTTTFTKDNGQVYIADDAFATGNAALADVEFGNITSTTTSPAGYSSIFTIGAGSNVFGNRKALSTVKFGTIDAGTFTIDDYAFESSGLTSVEFGNITTPYGKNSTFTIGDNAFSSAFIMGFAEPAEKKVKFGNISENNAGKMTFLIDDQAFTTEVSLTEVEIGNITAFAATIDQNAFDCPSLKKVKLGDITASANAASTFNINANAFLGGNVAAKTVEIGKIQNHPAPAAQNLTATIGANAFQADSLQSVKIGDMTAFSLTINAQAFEGKALTSVQLGNMTAATLAIPGNNAFANMNNEKALIETITIGDIGAGLNITGTNVFQGPQFDGSELNVTIAKLAGAATIPTNTFIAAPKGAATYTITGDVVAGSTTNIAVGAFVGSMENKLTPVENTTSVAIKGNYNADFAPSTFVNVNDAVIAVNGTTAKEYGVAVGELGAFDGVKYVTVGNLAAGKKIKGATAGANMIKEITFLKNVTNAGAIFNFISPDIRKIEFTNVEESGITVAAGAVAANAFTNACGAADGLGEKISVIYRENQTREAEVIFDQQAFDIAAGSEVVTLYTTSWAKANVYEAADVVLGTQCVFRMSYSESEVAPGGDIVANIVKKDGNKYGFAKLYIPKGVNMKYKIPAKYDADSDKNGIQLFYGRIDNSNNKIYMYSLPVIDDYYWIDATDVDQAFVMRTNSDIEPATSITAEPVTADEDAIFNPGDADHYYFGAALAVQNQLRYNPAEIARQELKNNAEFVNRAVYVMGNPKNYTNLTFAKFDKDYIYPDGHEKEGEYRNLAAKSLYIVGKVGTAAPEMEVVFEGDENFDAEATGIETVKTAENNGAIFNLQGVRVNNAQKGIYIINGKKVVVK